MIWVDNGTSNLMQRQVASKSPNRSVTKDLVPMLCQILLLVIADRILGIREAVALVLKGIHTWHSVMRLQSISISFWPMTTGVDPRYKKKSHLCARPVK